MNIDVLITTMNNSNIKKLLNDMNIQSNAIVGNQTHYNDIYSFDWNNNKIKVYNFNEKGVGLNRNNLLMRSTADICILGDDDMSFKNNYPDEVISLFKKYEDVDIIIFNIDETVKTRYITKKVMKINFFNCFRFGAARIAFRRKSVAFNNIYFNQLFGGGCPFSHGEDTIFLVDCLKANLNIIAVPISIAKLNQSKSTWFNGYTNKYFQDQGILFYAISRKFYKFLCLQDVLRHRKEYGNNSIAKYKLMIKGVNYVKNKY